MKYFSLLIASIAFYIAIVNLSTSMLMDYYHSKRMELWPTKEAFIYSAKWYNVANVRDKLLFFFPPLGFVNNDPKPLPIKGKEINENWDGLSINVTKPFIDAIKPDSVYLEISDLYHWMHPRQNANISFSDYPMIYYGSPINTDNVSKTPISLISIKY